MASTIFDAKAARAAEIERHLSFGTSRAFYEGRALETLVETFLGPDAGHRAIRFPDGPPDRRVSVGGGRNVALHLGFPLAGSERWRINLGLAHDRQSHRAEFLGDTYRITLEGVMAQLELERRDLWHPASRPVRTRLAAGTGVARFEASLRSSLIAVDVEDWALDTYLRAGIAVSLPGQAGRGGPWLETALTGYRSGGYDLTFGMAFGF